MSTFTTSIHPEQLGQKETGWGGGLKRNPDWKGEVKLFLFLDNLFYIENHRESTKKTFVVIYEFSRVAGYKMNIQKPVVFPYTWNE